MKKAFLSLAMVALLLCSACGGSADAAVSVSGTWYSVSNEGMYNFSDGSITLSGVTVGQYEDNGDSVVISMIDDGSNLQLYVTKMGDIDVLADVREGNGNVYFCKGLENAKSIMKDTQINEFRSYLNENLIGVWEVYDPNNKDNMDFVEFVSDDLIRITSFGSAIKDYPCVGVEYDVKDGDPYAEFSVYFGSDTEDIFHITITPTSDFPESGDLIMDEDRLLQKVK